MQFHQAVAFLETDQYLQLAQASEELGFSGMYVSDHLCYPKELRSRYTYSPYDDGSPVWAPETDWPDTWCVISAMAAVTSTLQFTTGVYVAPARDLMTVAKLVGTAAVLSGNRVNLGVAAGWCKEEFDLTGQEFSDRGRRLDDMIPALRALWRSGWVEYHGSHYDVPLMQVNPAPTKPVPVIVGGDSAPALRRTAALGDGWAAARVLAPHAAMAQIEQRQGSARRRRPDHRRLSDLHHRGRPTPARPHPAVRGRRRDRLDLRAVDGGRPGRGPRLQLDHRAKDRADGRVCRSSHRKGGVMSDPVSPASMQELLDRFEIDDLLTRYTMAVDNAEWDLLDTVFTPDARIDYTSAGGIAGDRDEIKQWLAEALAVFPVRQHLLGNKRVTIDGDTAAVRAYFFNPMYLQGPGESDRYAPGGGYYNHALVRTSDGWRSRELIEEEVWREGLSDQAVPQPGDG